MAAEFLGIEKAWLIFSQAKQKHQKIVILLPAA
jgi:hypothetical protein